MAAVECVLVHGTICGLCIWSAYFVFLDTMQIHTSILPDTITPFRLYCDLSCMNLGDFNSPFPPFFSIQNISGVILRTESGLFSEHQTSIALRLLSMFSNPNSSNHIVCKHSWLYRNRIVSKNSNKYQISRQLLILAQRAIAISSPLSPIDYGWRK